LIGTKDALLLSYAFANSTTSHKLYIRKLLRELWMISGLLRHALVMALSVSSMLFCFGSCTVGPDFRKPQADTPAQWAAMPQAGVSTELKQVAGWWFLFQDSMLNSLVDRAVASNLDLQLAEARIREARALRRLVSADLYPNINSTGAYSRIRRSENSTTDAGGDFAGNGISNEQDLFEAGFDAAWEIDIFGRIRRAIEAADAQLAVTIWDRRDVLVSLLSEVGRNYMELRGAQTRIAILNENIALQQKSLDLTQGRLEAGLGNQLDVAQAEALLTTTQSQAPALQAFAKQAIHRLGVLLGLSPEALLGELAAEGPIPPVPPTIPIDLPSELLRRRPDIRVAEMQLAAATARIGQATADLFPSFSLTGLLGLQSANIQDFFKPGSLLWNVGPGVSWPIFDAGRIRANIEVQNARQEQALTAYAAAVLASLEDVENALVAYDKERKTRESLLAAVDANRRAADISSELYSEGLVDFLNVLVSQRALSQSEDELVQSDQRLMTSLVALFKALGGGWELSDDRLGGY
jgi:outer membrane protein, multidrug efflux system